MVYLYIKENTRIKHKQKDIMRTLLLSLVIFMSSVNINAIVIERLDFVKLYKADQTFQLHICSDALSKYKEIIAANALDIYVLDTVSADVKAIYHFLENDYGGKHGVMYSSIKSDAKDYYDKKLYHRRDKVIDNNYDNFVKVYHEAAANYDLARLKTLYKSVSDFIDYCELDSKKWLRLKCNIVRRYGIVKSHNEALNELIIN